MLDGTSQDGCRHCVVHREAGARFVRDLCGGAQVGDSATRVGRGLDPDDARPTRTEHSAQCVRLAVRHQIQLKPLPFVLHLEPAAQHPVHLDRRNDMRADLQRLERADGRRYTGAEQHRGASPLEVRQQFLRWFVGRILIARVDPARGRLAVRGPLVLHCRMNRRDQSPGGRIDPPARLGSDGGWPLIRRKVRQVRSYACAGPMSTAMSRHLPWWKRATLNVARAT